MSLRKRIVFFVAFVGAIAAVLLPSITTATAADNRDQYNTTSACGDQWPHWSLYRAFDQFTVKVNGNTIINKVGHGPMSTSNQRSRILDDVLGPGDTVTVTFKLAPECDNTYVASNIYYAPLDHFTNGTADQQVLAWRNGKAYSAGTVNTISTTIPSECYYQWDFNTGWEYKPGDYTLDHLGRLYLAANGGSHPCQVTTTTKPTTTTSTSTTSTSTTSTTVVEHNAAAEVEQVCAADSSGWNVTYTNNGNVSENLVLRSGDDVIETVAVAAGKTVTKKYLFKDYDLEVGDSIDLVAYLGDEKIGELKVTNNCAPTTTTTIQPTTTTTAPPTTIAAPTTTTTAPPTEVLGQQIVRPQLAATGATTNISVALGSMLLLIGVGFLALARRIRLV